MRASDRCELDGLDWGLLSLGEGVEAEDLGVVGAFVLEVTDAAEVKFGVFKEEGLQFGVESCAIADCGEIFGRHVDDLTIE